MTAALHTPALARVEALLAKGHTIREAFEASGGAIRFVNGGRTIHADCAGLTARHTQCPSKACANWLHKARRLERKGH